MLEIADLKKKHQVILGVEINGICILFRPLTRREWETYSSLFASGAILPGKIEDKIFREIALDEGIVDRMYQLPAGIVPSIVSVDMLFSGRFLRTDEDISRVNNDLLNARDSVALNIFDQYTALICKAFPAYTPDDIDNKSLPEFYRLLMLTEIVLGVGEPFEIKKAAPERSNTKRYFEDARRAQQVDSPGGPSNIDIRDELRKAQRPDLSTAMARQLETERQAKIVKQNRDRKR